MDDNTVKVVGYIVAVQDISGAVVLNQPPLSGTVDTAGAAIPGYEGEYIVTPQAVEQILPTKDTLLAANIVINPIPSNYGLITWNGSTLTVS